MGVVFPGVTNTAEDLDSGVADGGQSRILLVANRLLSSKALHRTTRLAMGIPRPGALSPLKTRAPMETRAPSNESDKHA
jgi:hypothetical protein